MKAVLAFLSSLLLLMLPITAQAQDTEPGRTERCAFRIETEKGYVSGILLTRDSGETLAGSMVNEFGVSALDFSYDKSRCRMKLVNVAGFLNKWYIRMVLKRDLAYCMHELYGVPFKGKGKYEVTRNGGELTVYNPKRKLRYVFSPIDAQEIPAEQDNAADITDDNNETEGESL